MNNVIAEGVIKSYGNVTALSGIGFEAAPGELFGIIGPDGAGKTSIFRILATLLLPDSGRAEVCGIDCVGGYRDVRRIVGYMPGRFSLYQDLSVEENLRFFATIFNTSIEENISLVSDIYEQLSPFKRRRAGALSGGMKQKLALCCALIHKPRVLLLDEPTTGVDPVSRQEFWTMLRRLKEDGITIIVSTPYMDEATLCDRVMFLMGGETLDTDTPQAIVEKFGRRLWAVRGDNMNLLLSDIRSFSGTESCYAFGESYHLLFSGDSPLQDDLARFLESKGRGVVSITPQQPSIEDCFIKLSGDRV